MGEPAKKTAGIEIKSIDQINGSNVLDDSVFEFIFKEDNELKRERLIREIRSIAEDAKKKTDFNHSLSAARREDAKAKQKRSREIGNRTFSGDYQHFFDEGEPEEYTPLHTGSWVADKNGIKLYDGSKGEITACYQPVTIVNYFENVQTHEEKIKIAFKRGNVWKEITPNRSVVYNHSKIVSLADAGLNVSSQSARYLVGYLQDLEGLNQGSIPMETSSSKLGWINNGGKTVFVPYDNSIIFDAEERFRQVWDSIKQVGDKEKWFDLAKGIRKSGRIESRIAIAASLASVLVGMCGVNPFMINIFGKTEGGKTVCAMLASSVWANPAIGQGFMGDFNTTPAALEARSDLLNDLPLVLDDSAKKSKKFEDDFSEIIYTICNGIGKDRSNKELGIRYANSWHNITITTGEHPIVRELSQGGAINRVLSVKCGDGKIFSDGHFVAETLKENYGWCGRAFTDAVSLIGKPAVKSLHEAFYEAIRSKANGLLDKQMQAASVILAADSIANEYIFKDNNTIGVDEIIPLLRTVEDVDEEQKCLDYVFDMVNANYNKFYVEGEEHSKDEAPRGDAWGKIDTVANKVYFFPSVLYNLIEQNGYSPKNFLEWAAKKRNLIDNDSGRNKKTTRIRLTGKICKTICINFQDE
jgi:Superfamily II helicase and inactivated derivatives